MPSGGADALAPSGELALPSSGSSNRDDAGWRKTSIVDRSCGGGKCAICGADALPPSGVHAVPSSSARRCDDDSRIMLGSNSMLSNGASSDDDAWIKPALIGDSRSDDDNSIKIEASVACSAAEAAVR